MKTNTFLRCSLLACTLLAMPAPAREAGQADPLALDAKAQQAAGIVLARAAPRVLADELKAPGEVKANAYATVLVSPRVEAQVLARKARLGEVVQAGDPLVELSSVAVAETQGALVVAEQDWRRIAGLGPQAVSARRYNEAKVARDQARAKLRAYGLSDAQVSALLRKGSAAADGSFELLAPASGRIASDDFLVGERIEPGRTLFTLTREDSVWVEARLAPADAAKLKAGDRARVIAHGEVLPGTVAQRPHRIDERTRTVPVRIAVDNRDDRLHPGEMVDARLLTGGGAAVLAVPDEAVVLLQNQPTVFVARAPGRFEPAPVAVGESRGGWTVVTQGLAPGASYVSRGAFALKARLLRSQLGEE